MAFVILYVLGELRNLFAYFIGQKVFKNIKYIKYIDPDLEDEEDFDEESKKEEEEISTLQKIKAVLTELYKVISNFLKEKLIFMYNLLLWSLKEVASRKDMTTMINKCVNAYFAFLSFSFMYDISILIAN